jgi:hypothetical protein
MTDPTFVPAPYLGADAARDLIIAALLVAGLLVLLWLLAYGCWVALRAGHRNWQAMRADDTQELPVVEDIPADNHPTHRYPCVTSAEYPTAVIYIPPSDNERLAALDRELFPHVTAEYVTQLSALYLIPGVDFR